MTKKFDVIPVEDYGVVVDKEAQIQVGDNYYNVSINEFGRALDTTISQIRYEEEHGIIRYKLIGSIDKRVRMWHGEGLPLIELPIKSNRMELLAEAAREWDKVKDVIDRSVDSKTANIYWMAGYVNKAAQSKGYSEEDMRKAHWHGWFVRERYHGPDKHGYEDKLPANWKDMDYEEREDWFADQLIQSLQKNKLPAAVELEMEAYNPPEEQHLGVHKHLRVKVTDPETNTIKPVEVYYE